jgi:filamentous hemagglutinin family protein
MTGKIIMNLIIQKAFKNLNLKNSFRKIVSYVLIFSILWQNSLWAVDGLYTIEEDLGVARARTYNGRRVAIVDPGTIRDHEIHNVFEDFQLLDQGGVVFTGAPNTTKIYNRIYSADPIQLSGVVEADYPLPMVFSNPGGIVLENPDFQNIHDLTLTAGTLAQTNKGMAYGVDDGSVLVNQTVIRDKHDVKTLSLAGRGIYVQRSLLSPSECLILRAGQHVKGWKKKEGHEKEWVSEDYIEPNECAPLNQQSIVLDDSTILSSKGLYLESLEEGTEIRSHGVLQAVEEDIIIRARGDVYIDKLFANRNLKIKTTGRVFLGKQAFVGGNTKIQASHIFNYGDLIGNGQIIFKAPWAQNDGFIQTHGLLDSASLVNSSQGCVKAKSLMTPLFLLTNNLGSFELQDDLKFHVTNNCLKGTFKTQGKLELSGQNLTIEGNVSAQKGILFKGLKTLTTATSGILSALGEGIQGTIETLINNGKTILSSAKAQMEKLSNTGLFSALEGGLQGRIKNLENTGKMDFSSINAWIGRSINKKIGEKRGVIRTRGHSILQGDHHFNEGHIFTGGVQQTILTGTYKDSGIFYSPSLLLLNARDVEYVGMHQSFLKDGVIRASSYLSVGEKVSFQLHGDHDPCFLQLNSEGDLRYNGNISLFCSSGFPIQNYFKLFNQGGSNTASLKKEISNLSLAPWKDMRRSLGSGITFQAKGNINCEKATLDPENGSVSLVANGQFYTNNAKIKAGYFKGNNASVQGRTAALNNTKLSSLFGSTSIFAQDTITLTNSTVEGALGAALNANTIGINHSQVNSFRGNVGIYGEETGSVMSSKSSYSAHSGLAARGGDIGFKESHATSQGTIQFQATQDATFTDSSLTSKSFSSLIAKNLSLYSSQVEARENAVYLQGANMLKAQDSHFISPSLISLMGGYIHFRFSTLKSQDSICFNAKKSTELNNVQLEGQKGVNVITSALTMNSSHVQSSQGLSRIQVEEKAKITDSVILSKLLATLHTGDVSFEFSKLISQEENTQVIAKLATLKDSTILAKGLAALMGEDVTVDSCTLTSQEQNAYIQAKKSARITNSHLLAQYAASVSGQDVTVHSSTISSQKDKVQLQGTTFVNIKASEILGQLLVAVSGENVSLESSTVKSQEDKAQIQAAHSVTLKGSEVLGRLLTSVMGQDIYLDSSKISSQEGNAQLQATSSATIKGSEILGKLLAFVSAEDVSFDSSKLISQEDKAQLQATQSAKVSVSIILARALASIVGKDVTLHSSTLESQEDISLIVATRLAQIIQSNLKGKTTSIEAEKVILSNSHLEGTENNVTAKEITATSNTINGNSFLKAGQVHVHDLTAEGSVTTLGSSLNLSDITVNKGSLQAQGKQIKVDGTLVVEKLLALIGETVEQLGRTKAGENTSIEATDRYIDTQNSHNEAGENLFLIAPETEGFKGYQKAGNTLQVTLKDMDLFSFLNQSEARITKAYLREADVKFNEDFILDRTLHLWGKSLENKARFTATKDFIAHMQDVIMNEGSMIVQGDINLESQGLLANFGQMEAANLNAKGKVVLNESQVTRKSIPGGDQDEVSCQATMRATRGDLHVEAIDLLQSRGGKFEAKLNMRLKSAGVLYLGAQQLHSEVSQTGKRFSHHRYTLNHLKTDLNAGGNIGIEAGEGMIFEGLNVKAAGYIHAKSEGTFENRPVHSIVQEESHQKKKGGTFKKKKEVHAQTAIDTVDCNTFQAGTDIQFESEGDNLQQAPRIESKGPVKVVSHQGKVIIKTDKSSHMHSTQKSSKNAVWQKQQQTGCYDETIEMLEVLSQGGIHIWGAQGVEAQIRGGENRAQALDLLEQHKETEWVKNLRQNPHATWRLIGEGHKKWNKTVQGLTGPAVAVISLAIAIATQGTGAGLISGLTTNATIGSMASAGFTSVVSQASIALINNQGNLGKTFKELGSKENLRSLAMSIAEEGLTQGISEPLGVSASPISFTDYLKRHLVSSGATGILSIPLQKEDPTGALLNGLKNGIINAAGAWAAGQIGSAFHPQDGSTPKIDPLTHKFLHALVGAGLGAVTTRNTKEGAFAGGLAAASAEILAEALPDTLGLSTRANLSHLAVALGALFTDLDVDAAISAARNALENNFKSKEEQQEKGEEKEESSDSWLDKLESWYNKEHLPLVKIQEHSARENREAFAQQEKIYKSATTSSKEKVQAAIEMERLDGVYGQIQDMPVSQGWFYTTLINAAVDAFHAQSGGVGKTAKGPKSAVQTTRQSKQTKVESKTPLAAQALNRKLSALESAQKNAELTKNLPDGRIRYYDKLRAAKTEGPTIGSRYVTEYNPKTGEVRDWIENYTKEGGVNRVHPKMINGQTVNVGHYPPTAKELERDKK